MTAEATDEEGTIMAGTLRIKITESQATLASAKYAYLWSAWLEGDLLGKGYCFRPSEGIARAHDLANPDEVERVECMEIIEG